MNGVSMPIFAAMLIVFAVLTIALGLYGYKHTKDNSEFLLGRNKTNPIIIGLSYGATFLSASAVIGFGGQSAVHGLSLMWLCFLNLFVGLFVAFLVFGPRTRRIGKKLGASTFADLLGKMYRSKGIRGFTAILIIVMMPIYCAAVLKGGVNSVAVLTGLQDYYDLILVILSIIVGIYVVYGGIIAVMYNDALQAGIMFIGMAVILIVTASELGGLTHGFEQLADLFKPFAATGTRPPGTLDGFNGWTEMAAFGSSEWMLVVTTFIMGVGLGVLTQPQLIVRFMSAKDDKMLNRSLIVGSIFMLVIVGTAYTCGALSNVYFMQHDGHLASSIATDFIVPQYILEIFNGVFGGDFFVCLFLLSLVCASVSTISALMHTIGAAGGYDLYTLIENRKKKREEDSKSVKVNRCVTAIMMVLVVLYCYVMPNDIIAKATSLFMGMTAAALLPAFCHGLYTKGIPDKRAAAASIAVGTASYLFWALFINKSSSVFLPICQWITGQQVLFTGPIALCDSLMVALPLSIIVFVVVHYLGRSSSRNADTASA